MVSDPVDSQKAQDIVVVLNWGRAIAEDPIEEIYIRTIQKSFEAAELAFVETLQTAVCE